MSTCVTDKGKGVGTEEPFDAAEVVRRRDEALKRALRMPPKPHEDMKLGKPRRKDGKASRPSVGSSDEDAPSRP